MQILIFSKKLKIFKAFALLLTKKYIYLRVSCSFISAIPNMYAKTLSVNNLN